MSEYPSYYLAPKEWKGSYDYSGCNHVLSYWIFKKKQQEIPAQKPIVIGSKTLIM